MMKFFLPFRMLLFLLNPTIFIIIIIILTFLFLKPSGLVIRDYRNFLGVDEVVF